MAKDTRIALRTSKDLKNRLQNAAQTVGLNETTLAEACVEALVRYIEEHGEIRLPLSVVPTSELKKGDTLGPHRNQLSSSTVPRLNPPPPDRLIVNEEPQTQTIMPRPRTVKYTAPSRSSRSAKTIHNRDASL